MRKIHWQDTPRRGRSTDNEEDHLTADSTPGLSANAWAWL